MKLTLVTPEKRVLLDQEVTEVTLPAFKGELNILPGHQPLITTLVPGIIRYKLREGGVEMLASISWGYCHISAEGVNVLAENVETGSEIDYKTAKEELAKAEKQILTETMDDDTWKQLQDKMDHAKARLQMENFTKH